MSKRENSVREFVYEEPSLLDMPPAPDGYTYRWIRVMIMGNQGYEDDIKNISLREREGFVFVREDELDPEWRNRLPVRESGRYEGVIGHGDVALAKIPTERAEARHRFYEQKAQDMEHAINVQLGQASRQNPKMPIYNESTSKVTTGTRATSFD